MITVGLIITVLVLVAILGTAAGYAGGRESMKGELETVQGPPGPVGPAGATGMMPPICRCELEDWDKKIEDLEIRLHGVEVRTGTGRD